MAISIQALRDKKAEKAKAARELQNKEDFTAEDQAAFEALIAEAAQWASAQHSPE